MLNKSLNVINKYYIELVNFNKKSNSIFIKMALPWASSLDTNTLNDDFEFEVNFKINHFNSWIYQQVLSEILKKCALLYELPPLVYKRRMLADFNKHLKNE